MNVVNTLKPGSIITTLKTVLKDREKKEVEEGPIIITSVLIFKLIFILF